MHPALFLPSDASLLYLHRRAAGPEPARGGVIRKIGEVAKDHIVEMAKPASVVGTRRLVFPIRNRKEGFFELSPWFLGDHLRADEISDEDYATLHREEESFLPVVSANSQCIVSDLEEGQDAEQVAYDIASKIQFVFKTFSASPPIMSHAAVIVARAGSKACVESTFLLPVLGDYERLISCPFVFRDDAAREQIFDLLSVIDVAMQKQPSFVITLSRFNSCYLRSNDHDKVIDVAVSLESLLSSYTEIAFKFALFTAFVAHAEPARREETFRLLQVLYSARSSIVHGDTKSRASKKAIESTLNSLDAIFEIAHAAISYYALFLYSKEPKDWPLHLQRIVLGTEQRLS
jgi:Apea-like HEPN